MTVDKAEILSQYNILSERIELDLVDSAKINVRLFIYECCHLIKSDPLYKDFYYDALRLVNLQDKYKFEIIYQTLKLLISQSSNIDEVKRYTFNALDFLQHLQNRMYQDSYFDKLTGIFNFNYLQKIESEISPKDFTLFFFDLDDLKKKNDQFGHEYGNQVISAFAQVLKSSFRFSDTLIRYGGDEFVVIILRDHINPRQIIRKINAHPLIEQYNLRYSFGFATNIEKDLGKTLSSADRLMYAHKESK